MVLDGDSKQRLQRSFRRLCVAILFVAMVTSMVSPFYGIQTTGAVQAAEGDENWQTPVGGIGSSVSVVDGSVYAGDGNGGTVYSLDDSTGNVQWTYSPGGSFEPRSTPHYYKGSVYVGSGGDDSRFVSINASTGNEEWTYTAGNRFSESPVANNGTVYAASVDNNLYAFDADTGNVEWTYTAVSGITAAPVLYNGTVYVMSDKMYAGNASTGNLEWSYDTGNYPYDGATADGGLVYFSDETGMYAVDAATGNLEWSNSISMGTTASVPTVHSGTLYIGTGGNTYALDAKTGNVEWSESMGAFESSPTVSNGLVYVGSDNGNLYALDQSDGSVQWTYNEGTAINSDPVVAAGDIYFGGESNAIYSVDSGHKLSSDDSRVLLNTTSFYGNSYKVSSYSLSGTVTNSESSPISGVTITAYESDGSVIASDSTDSVGSYGLSLINGTYDIEATKDNYTTQTKSITIDGSDETLDFTLEKIDANIEFHVRPYMTHGSEQDYRVIIQNDTGRHNVSSQASVVSQDPTIVSVSEPSLTLTATNNTSVNQRIPVTANYTGTNGQEYEITKNVTVANATVENLEILPTWPKVSASLGTSIGGVYDHSGTDLTLRVILVATILASAAALVSRSFAGIAAFAMIMVVGWLAGWVGNGIVIVSFMTAAFIGLNVAANVEYSVRR